MFPNLLTTPPGRQQLLRLSCLLAVNAATSRLPPSIITSVCLFGVDNGHSVNIIFDMHGYEQEDLSILLNLLHYR